MIKHLVYCNFSLTITCKINKEVNKHISDKNNFKIFVTSGPMLNLSCNISLLDFKSIHTCKLKLLFGIICLQII